MTPLETLEKALREHGCKGGRGSWTCPAHEDRSPSLSARSGADGRALVHCFAGCETAEVLAALGLTARELFDGPRPTGWIPPPTPPRWFEWAPPKPTRAKIGLPTWDDVFWTQPDEIIDAHFARLLAGEVAP